MGNKYSLEKISKYLEKEDIERLRRHSLVFKSRIIPIKDHNKTYFKFKLHLEKGYIDIFRYILKGDKVEFDPHCTNHLVNFYEGELQYKIRVVLQGENIVRLLCLENKFKIKYINKKFYDFAYTFVKDRLFLKVLLACHKTTFKQYIDSLPVTNVIYIKEKLLMTNNRRENVLNKIDITQDVKKYILNFYIGDT